MHLTSDERYNVRTIIARSVFPNVDIGRIENDHNIVCEDVTICYSLINDIRLYTSWEQIVFLRPGLETRQVPAFHCGSYDNYQLPDNTIVHFYVTDGPQPMRRINMKDIFAFIVYFKRFDVLFPEIFYANIDRSSFNTNFP